MGVVALKRHSVRSRIAALLCTTLTIPIGLGACDSPYDDSYHETPPPPIPYPELLSPDAVITALTMAYRRRDLDKLSTLLHPEFQFLYYPLAPGGPESWNAAEEIRIHRRMFRPADIQPPEAPLPVELWCNSIDIALSNASDWEVAVDSTGEFVAAVYNATVFFETQGNTDFRIDGPQAFVVKPDPSTRAGEARKYLLSRWIETASRSGGWGRAKALYRTPVPTPEFDAASATRRNAGEVGHR